MCSVKTVLKISLKLMCLKLRGATKTLSEPVGMHMQDLQVQPGTAR